MFGSYFTKFLILVYHIDKALLQTVNNHPVHILNKAGEYSPSSLIPFCSFGKNFIGVNVNAFDIPLCNIFKPRNYFDQLCYETDLQKMKDSKKLLKQLEMGLTLVLDYNEERQLNGIFIPQNKSNKMDAFNNDDDGDSVSIYLDTISKQFEKILVNILFI